MADPANEHGPDPIDVEIGRRIRQLRKARGLSQTALGEQVGVTFQQVQKYERGTNRISTSTLVRMARALSVPLAELLADFDQTTEPWRGWRLPDAPGIEELSDSYASIQSPEIRRAVLAVVRGLAEGKSIPA